MSQLGDIHVCRRQRPCVRLHGHRVLALALAVITTRCGPDLLCTRGETSPAFVPPFLAKVERFKKFCQWERPARSSLHGTIRLRGSTVGGHGAKRQAKNRAQGHPAASDDGGGGTVGGNGETNVRRWTVTKRGQSKPPPSARRRSGEGEGGRQREQMQGRKRVALPTLSQLGSLDALVSACLPLFWLQPNAGAAPRASDCARVLNRIQQLSRGRALPVDAQTLVERCCVAFVEELQECRVQVEQRRVSAMRRERGHSSKLVDLKYLSIAANSLRHEPLRHLAFFEEVSRFLISLPQWQERDTERGRDLGVVSEIGDRDQALRIVRKRHAPLGRGGYALEAQSVAMLANALTTPQLLAEAPSNTKGLIRDAMQVLLDLSALVAVADWTPQGLAMLAGAAARARFKAQGMHGHTRGDAAASHAAAVLPSARADDTPARWNAGGVAMEAEGSSGGGAWCAASLEALSQAVLAMHPSSFGAQAAATMAHGLTRCGYGDEEVLAHLAAALTLAPPSQWTGQTAALAAMAFTAEPAPSTWPVPPGYRAAVIAKVACLPAALGQDRVDAQALMDLVRCLFEWGARRAEAAASTPGAPGWEREYEWLLLVLGSALGRSDGDEVLGRLMAVIAAAADARTAARRDASGAGGGSDGKVDEEQDHQQGEQVPVPRRRAEVENARGVWGGRSFAVQLVAYALVDVDERGRRQGGGAEGPRVRRLEGLSTPTAFALLSELGWGLEGGQGGAVVSEAMCLCLSACVRPAAVGAGADGGAAASQAARSLTRGQLVALVGCGVKLFQVLRGDDSEKRNGSDSIGLSQAARALEAVMAQLLERFEDAPHGESLLDGRQHKLPQQRCGGVGRDRVGGQVEEGYVRDLTRLVTSMTNLLALLLGAKPALNKLPTHSAILSRNGEGEGEDDAGSGVDVSLVLRVCEGLVAAIALEALETFDARLLACAYRFVVKFVESGPPGAVNTALPAVEHLSQVVLLLLDDTQTTESTGSPGTSEAPGRRGTRLNWTETSLILNSLAKINQLCLSDSSSPPTRSQSRGRRHFSGSGKGDDGVEIGGALGSGKTLLAMQALARCAASWEEAEGPEAERLDAEGPRLQTGPGVLEKGLRQDGSEGVVDDKLDGQALALVCGALAKSYELPSSAVEIHRQEVEMNSVGDEDSKGAGVSGTNVRIVEQATLVWRVASYAYRLTPSLVAPRHAAAILNALAHMTLRDDELVLHLAQVVLSHSFLAGKGSEITQLRRGIDAQSLSMSLHALARLNMGHLGEVVEALVREIVVSDGRQHSASGIANIAWAGAVLDIPSAARRDLRGWIFEGVYHHTASMDRESMQQIQQFLLDCALHDSKMSSGFSNIRKDRLKIMSAARSAPSFLDVGSLQYGISSTGQDMEIDMKENECAQRETLRKTATKARRPKKAAKESHELQAGSRTVRTEEVETVGESQESNLGVGEENVGKANDDELREDEMGERSSEREVARTTTGWMRFRTGREEDRKDGKGGAGGKVGWQREGKRGITISRVQDDVAATLWSMGFDIEMEVLEPRTRYTMDVWLPRENLAIEVDGPFHYALELRAPGEDQSKGLFAKPSDPYATSYSSRPSIGLAERGAGKERKFVVRGRQPLGSTALKHRHLADVGVRLYVVAYWDWDLDATLEQKALFLAQLLPLGLVSSTTMG